MRYSEVQRNQAILLTAEVATKELQNEPFHSASLDMSRKTLCILPKPIPSSSSPNRPDVRA
jgi:hypothetical protein